MRYGRQYFRPISGDGIHFGISTFGAGVLAFSRILQDLEALVVLNTNTQASWSGQVLVDYALNPAQSAYQLLYSNQDDARVTLPGAVVDKAAGAVEIREVDGAVTLGPARALPVTLQPCEVQILAKP